MATLDDILTTQKNGVIAINNLNQTMQKVSDDLQSIEAKTQYLAGKTTSAVVVGGSPLTISGSGWLANFSVVVAGSAAGTVSSNTTSTLAATPTTIGVYPCGQKFTTNLVVSPGTGQSVVVTYSLD